MAFRSHEDGYIPFDIDWDVMNLASQGIGVISGCEVSWSTGTTVEWTAGILRVAAGEVSTSASSLDLSSLQASLVYKKAIVFYDTSAGAIAAVAGDAHAVVPSGQTGRYTRFPVPPDFSGSSILCEDDVVLAEVWLRPSGTSIQAGDVTDRRVGVVDRHTIDSVQPTVITQKITGASGQTANLFVVEVYGGTDKFVIDSDGDVVITGNLTLTGSMAYTGEMAITGDTAATITLKITGASGQSADLLVVEDNNGTDYFKVGSTGNATLVGDLTQTGSQAVTGEVQITGDTAATITTKITGASGQTADLFVVEQNDGTDVFKVDIRTGISPSSSTLIVRLILFGSLGVPTMLRVGPMGVF